VIDQRLAVGLKSRKRKERKQELCRNHQVLPSTEWQTRKGGGGGHRLSDGGSRQSQSTSWRMIQRNEIRMMWQACVRRCSDRCWGGSRSRSCSQSCSRSRSAGSCRRDSPGSLQWRLQTRTHHHRHLGRGEDHRPQWRGDMGREEAGTLTGGVGGKQGNERPEHQYDGR